MNIKELADKKIELENEISRLIEAFQKETGVSIGCVEFSPSKQDYLTIKDDGVFRHITPACYYPCELKVKLEI